MDEPLQPGDVVEVRTAPEILSTLDENGALGDLPFMPEMVEACGQQYRIASRVTKTCMSGTGPSTMRALRSDDLFTLVDVRCSGAGHDGCQKGCLVFWRAAWLRKPVGAAPASRLPNERTDLAARLKTS